MQDPSILVLFLHRGYRARFKLTFFVCVKSRHTSRSTFKLFYMLSIRICMILFKVKFIVYNLFIVQTLRKGATEQEKTEFLKEAALMSNFKHEHILRLLGVCLDNDPNYIIMELMEGGDLLSYLRAKRAFLVSIYTECYI